ncbi:hypothetical protein J22TS1_12850 [Siminovitchia terrae]|nr:hypothetical protein J22TS1_12850 [Siminovitchia terrae]
MFRFEELLNKDRNVTKIVWNEELVNLTFHTRLCLLEEALEMDESILIIENETFLAKIFCL